LSLDAKNELGNMAELLGGNPGDYQVEKTEVMRSSIDDESVK
jgi:hypothetical protein